MNKSIISEEDFKEPKLYPQNTIDGSKPVKADLPDIIPNSIFVATPMMGSLKFGCVKSLLELQNLCMSKKIHVKFHMVQSSIVTQGRNMCVQAFLHTRYSHMLCIDSDIEFDSTSILMMLKADKEIVLTPYPMKVFDWDKARATIKKDPHRALEDCAHYYCLEFPDKNNIECTDGLTEIIRGPAGCMLIKREVFDKMKEAYPHMKIKQRSLVNAVMATSEELWNFFDTQFTPKTGEMLGEDYAFCKRWTDLQGKIYANVDAYIVHHGDHAYRGRFIDEGKKIK